VADGEGDVGVARVELIDAWDVAGDLDGTRTVRPTVPPRVDYALTPMGRTLLDTVRNLLEWADEHLPEIHAARAAYDRRTELLTASLDEHAGRLSARPD
jgi:DNA-binding PadR family transcriptional regulator